ncbi:MAG: pyridoxamine 5'-phosphate oxidase family protein [Hyphomicrobiaceae bacterium]|jgi:general stress protein 26
MNTQKHLYDLIKDFSTAMLVTHGANGGMHGRPMRVAQLEPDADAYFATSIDSPKVAEIEADPKVLVLFQSTTQFASLEGKATIVRDRALIEKLWMKEWSIWFPGGKDDPSLVLVKVDTSAGEYWDNSGLQGLQYLFKGLKAMLKSEKPEVDEKVHAKVDL